VLLAAAWSAAAAAQTRPNVVLILADDLGYGDVGAFNPGGRIPRLISIGSRGKASA
jgi:arylsulfatase A-like enzyme